MTQEGAVAGVMPSQAQRSLHSDDIRDNSIYDLFVYFVILFVIGKPFPIRFQ